MVRLDQTSALVATGRGREDPDPACSLSLSLGVIRGGVISELQVGDGVDRGGGRRGDVGLWEIGRSLILLLVQLLVRLLSPLPDVGKRCPHVRPVVRVLGRATDPLL